MNHVAPAQFILLTIIVLFAMRWNRSDKTILLQPRKFWALVSSQEKPLVLLANKGYFIKKICYVFPY